MGLKELVNNFGCKIANLYNSIREMEDTKELILEQKLLHAVSDILTYITKHECLDDDDIISLKIVLSKLFDNAKYNIDVIFNKRVNTDLFSIKEWNASSKERKLSILSFVFAGMSPNQTKEEDYELIFNQLDKDTLEWIKNNTPYKDIRESLIYQYFNDVENE